MNRNTELHFGAVPMIKQRRSKIDLSHTVKTTFNNGELIPLDVQEILPGDTVQIDMSCLIRMATPIYPVLDNMWCDVYWFFVPRRLTWDHWQEFWGENDDEWTQQNEYEIPQITAPSGGWASGTIADYMGIPTLIENISVDAQYFRSYAKIYSDWFRSENLQKSAHFYRDDTTRAGSNGTNYITDVEKGGMPAKACKMMDYFTGALPAPQKGPQVAIPLGTTASVSGDISTALSNISGTLTGFTANTYAGAPRELTQSERNRLSLVGGGSSTGDTIFRIPWFEKSTPMGNEFNYLSAMARADGFELKIGGGEFGEAYQRPNSVGPNAVYPNNLYTGIPTQTINSTGTATSTLSNAYADLSDATAATINELRTAFAIQKYYEASARYGTRYIEWLRGIFGVQSSDARLQRSEYLGGMRFLINMNQIVQTSSTDVTSPQGNVAGLSCTNVRDNCFTKSFEEHGILMCMLVTRTEHTYQQGLNKIFSRKKWTDFYNPYFANLGEMPIYNREIYCQGESNDTKNPETGEYYDAEVFGYQEAWAEYRYIPNRMSGNMRSNATDGSLDAWTYADNYNSLPHLDAAWIVEGTENVDNTIAVSSMLANQMWGDFYIKEYATRVMPVYSIPGLIDHA